MKFEFNGLEFDTEKPICVLGYEIQKGSWTFYSHSNSWDNQMMKEHGAKVKKFYVQELHFERINGVNTVVKMKLAKAVHAESWIINYNHIVGHSPQECLKLIQQSAKSIHH